MFFRVVPICLLGLLPLTAQAALDHAYIAGVSEPNSHSIDVHADGSLVAVLDESGLQFVDVSDPTAPVTLGEFTGVAPNGPLGRCADFTKAGGLYYLASGLTGLSIIDGTDPEAASEVRRLRFPFIRPDGSVGYSSAQSVAVHGDHAYVGTVGFGVKIVDITNPAMAITAATFMPPSTTQRAYYGLAIAGNYLYCANHIDGLRIAEISNPVSPTEVVHVPFPSGVRAYDVAVSGNYLYVSTQDNGLRVYNVTNPATPTLVTTVDCPGSGPNRMSLHGTRLYTALFERGVGIYDLSNPASPALLGNVPADFTDADFNYSAEGAYAANGYVYVALYGQNMRIYQEVGNSQLNRLGSLSAGFLDSPATNVACTATTAYVAQGSNGVKVINITNAAAPSVLSTISTFAKAEDLVLDGQQLTVAGGFAGVAVYQVSNPASPTLLGNYDPDGDLSATSPGNTRAVFREGSTVYVANGPLGVGIYDLTNPANGSTLGTVDTVGNACDVAKQGTLLYVADGPRIVDAGNTPIGGGLVVVDVSTPSVPSIVHTNFSDLKSARKVMVPSPNLLIVADDIDQSLVFFDLSMPSQPQFLAKTALGAPPTDFASQGQLLFVGQRGAGVVVFDISTPAAPRRYSGTQLVGAEGLAACGDKICVAEGNSSFVSSSNEFFALLSFTPPAAQPPFLKNPRIAGGSIQMDFMASAGQSYHLAKSTNLTTWNVVRTLTGTGNLVTESDPFNLGDPKVFYRLQTIP